MSANTTIEWTDATWPVLAGCKETSSGCANCYSARLTATRLKHTPKYRGLAVIGANGHPHFTGTSRLAPREHLVWPLRWRAPRKIFVADMSDLFYEAVTDDEIDRVFGVMWACLYLGRGDHAYDGHTFQVLTKRARRMREYLSQDRRRQWADHAVAYGGGDDPDGIHDQVRFHEGPHPRIWCGVSVESQRYADERIPELLATPAAVRFVSCEPLLGPVNVGDLHDGRGGVIKPLYGLHWVPTARGLELTAPAGAESPFQRGNRIDWVIVGGESGPGARPMDVAWARALVAQCAAAGVACFVKQVATDAGRAAGDRKGGDPQHWPADLRVREFPEVRAPAVARRPPVV